MKLMESMILSSKVLLTEAAPCVFPAEWNADLGNKFRAWFNQRFPSQASTYKLDKTGPYDNATIKTAYCWKPAGLETAGDMFMRTAGEEEYTIGGWPIRFYLIAAALVVVGAGVGFIWWYKINRARKLAKQVTSGIKNYKGNKADLLYDTITSFKDPYKRQQIIRKLTKGDSENKLISAEEKAAIEKAMKNPGVTEKVIDELHALYLQEFKAGNLSANEYIQAVQMDTNSVEAKALRAIERARKKSGNKTAWPSKDQLKNWKTKQSNKKTNTPKRTYKPIENSKLTYYMNPAAEDLEKAWFHLKGSVTPADVQTAINRTMTQLDLPFAQARQLRNTAPLSVDAISERLNSEGTYMLAKHANAETFPSFNVWMREVNAAGVKPQVSPGDIARYAKNRAIWNLIHRR
jgi:hypothetical protein